MGTINHFREIYDWYHPNMASSIPNRVQESRSRLRLTKPAHYSRLASLQRTRLYKHRSRNENRYYLHSEKVERRQSLDIHSHRTCGTLGGFWAPDQQDARELVDEEDEEKRACLILKAAKAIGYRIENGDHLDLFSKRKDDISKSPQADMPAQNSDLPDLNHDMLPTPAVTRMDVQYLELEVKNFSGASSSLTLGQERTPTIALDKWTSLKLCPLEANLLEMGQTPFRLPDSRHTRPPSTPFSDMLSQNVELYHSKTSFAQKAAASSRSFPELPPYTSNKHSSRESVNVHEAIPTTLLSSTGQTFQKSPVLICTNHSVLGSEPIPPRHRGLRKVQAQHSLRRCVISEQCLHDEKYEEPFIAPLYATGESDCATQSTLLADGSDIREPHDLQNLTESAANYPGAIGVASTCVSHTATDLSPSSLKSGQCDKKRGKLLVTSPICNSTSDSTGSLHGSRDIIQKVTSEIEVVPINIPKDIFRESKDEIKWEEITEPADLQICLAVLKREIQRRRAEVKAERLNVV